MDDGGGDIVITVVVILLEVGMLFVVVVDIVVDFMVVVVSMHTADVFPAYNLTFISCFYFKPLDYIMVSLLDSKAEGRLTSSIQGRSKD